MYRIAVCDDEEVFVDFIIRMMKQTVPKGQEQMEIYRYSSGEELIFDLEEKKVFDLLIVDIKLEGIDGNEVAKIFREKFQDAVIVFCSGVYQPTDENFKVTPFRYLLKSYTEEIFYKELLEIWKEVERKTKNSYIIGNYKRTLLRINIRNVLYIENAKRGSRIVVVPWCKEAEIVGPIYTKKKIGEIERQYKEMISVHNSYIVNLYHVDSITNKELQLVNGEHLSISRTYYKAFREAFTRNIANKY